MAVTRTRRAPLFEQFMAVRRFSGGLAFSTDGAYVYFISNISGQFNLWRVPVDGGWPDQLTAFTDDTVRFISVSPVDGTIAIGADHDGDEFHQIYLLDPDRGWPEKITDDPQVQHYVGGNAWSPDGTKLAYAANARTPTDMEVWIRDLDSGETRPVFGEGMYAFPGGWSPDGTKLLTLDFRHNSDASLYVVDVESGETRELTPHEDDALFFPGPWAADSSGFYMITDAGSEFRGVAYYDLEAGAYDWVDGEPEADVDDMTGSADHRYVAWLVNEGGWDRLRLRDLESGQDLPDPDIPRGARPHLTGFEPPPALSPDGSLAAVILASPRRPPEVWVVETETGNGRAVTESRIGGLREDDLVDNELIS
jgi:WD40 repeat protein